MNRRFQTPARLTAAAMTILAGAALLALSVPRTYGGLLMLEAEPALESVRAGQPAARRELATAIEIAERARQCCAPKYHYMSALANLQLACMTRSCIPGQSAGLSLSLSLALIYLEQSLARAPLQAGDWTRLAYGRSLAHGAAPPAFEALKMSYLTGRVAWELHDFRLRMVFDNWAAADETLKAYARTDIVWHARHDTAGLVTLYLEASRPIQELIERILSARPDELRVFRYILERRQGSPS